MIASGELGVRSQAALRASDPLRRARRRGAALDAGRATMTQRRAHALTERLRALGFDTLDKYLPTAYAANASLEHLARTTGLGYARLRTALDDAGVAIRPTGQNTVAGKRARAIIAEQDAARRVGTTDLHSWLRERHAAGWTLTRLAAAGHGSHWVRWRLQTCTPAA